MGWLDGMDGRNGPGPAPENRAGPGLFAGADDRPRTGDLNLGKTRNIVRPAQNGGSSGLPSAESAPFRTVDGMTDGMGNHLPLAGEGLGAARNSALCVDASDRLRRPGG